VLTGWKVTAPKIPPSRYDLRLPYGVRLEEPVSEARVKVPKSRFAKGTSFPDAGLSVVTTPQLPAFVLTPSDADGEGYVLEASYDPEGCR
jgi:hypothetical protein